MKRLLTNGFVAAVAFGVVSTGSAAIPKFEEVVEVKAECDPEAVKPGDTVTVKITATLAKDWYTYPLKQVDPNPTAQAQQNKLTLPSDTVLSFGAPNDPEEPKSKAEPELGIKKLLYLPGESTWTIPAKVAAGTKPGKHTIEVKFQMQVCGKPTPTAETDVCLRPKTVTVPVVVTVE